MKAIQFYISKLNLKPWSVGIAHILCLAVISWLAMPYVFAALQLTAGFVDIGIVHVVLLAFCCWLFALLAAYWLFRLLLQQLALPAILHLIDQFKLLSLWEQYLCYLAGYALLLCSAIGALVAVV